MDKPLNFQSIIMTLQHYWADRGCLIWQPYYTQVGAGTMNPATFLRVLGPEPWNVAYVEPSVRPDDGRFGENPNRLQQHYQFQVILKPDPGNPQELYLGSLKALGINPREHDIRFVEDNWESPALGAWGLGWEVWLDGQEITQFTYFQQAGGLNLNPNSVEITYGLDRIAIALQRVARFQDIQWNEDRTYGDVNYQGEYEHSQYYFNIADIDRLKEMYSLFEEEARSSLSKGLVLPALDYILKCSHTFNILDTRGAIGVTERQVLFGKMRELSRSLAENYLKQRQEMEYPWLNDSVGAKVVQKPAKMKATSTRLGRSADFLLEVGTEELPVADLSAALEQLQKRLPEWLKELRLEYEEIQVFGTPRRLVTFIKNLQTHQPDVSRLLKGPPADRAFDSNGKLTPAGEGFAHSKGIDPAALSAAEIDGGSYAVAKVEEKGQPASDVLAGALPGLIAGIRFEKSMRWNDSGVAFSRPIRWLLSMLGGNVIPFEYAGIQASNMTRGLRFYQPESMEIRSSIEYFKYIDSQGIILDVQRRKEAIKEQVSKALIDKKGLQAYDEGLLEEVTNLLETPTILVGSFDKAHLNIPEEVLITVLKKHQRFFPVQSEKGLLPYFIALRNGDDQHLDVIREGYDHVVRARFADADFFIREDKKQSLEAFKNKLAMLQFQRQLGSMLDKSYRIKKLVTALAPQINLSADEIKVAEHASELCKADLATKMVVEITSLQGVMGKYYALYSGESEQVADAIFEHYLPRYADDRTPKGKPGLVIGLADRLDTLAGLFAVGMAPTGTKDPFAQRRAAIGLIHNLITWDIDFDIKKGLEVASGYLPVKVASDVLEECLKFIIGRMRASLLDDGYRYDVIDSVLSILGSNPALAMRNIRTLSASISVPGWQERLQAYSRCARIVRSQEVSNRINPELLREDAEKDLYKAYCKAQKALHDPMSYLAFNDAFVDLIKPINDFFDGVLVMDEDREIRDNRLSLLKMIVDLGTECADLSMLEGF